MVDRIEGELGDGASDNSGAGLDDSVIDGGTPNKGKGKGGRPRKDGSPAQPRTGNSGGTKPLKTGGGGGGGNSGGEAAREDATVRPSERGNGSGRKPRSGAQKKASSDNLGKASFKFINTVLTRLGGEDLVFTDEEQKDIAAAWGDFAEHWLPDFDSPLLNPKWPALGVMLWTIYQVGEPRLAGLADLKAKRARDAKAPPGKGPIVEGESAPVASKPFDNVFTMNPASDPFKAFGDVNG